MKTNRLQWLDIAKGIAIILMVLGHSSLPATISNFIYAFHMPLFFIASGFTTNWNKYKFYDYLCKKNRTLLLPFIIYSFIIIVIFSIIGSFSITNWLSDGWGGYALWFIPVIFISSLISKFIMLIPNRKINILMWFACFFIGSIMSYCGFNLPWSMDVVPYATFLIILGSKIRRFNKLIYKSNVWFLLIVCIITIVISHFWKLDMAWNKITPTIPLTIGAISGTIFIFIISLYINNQFSFLTKILRLIGCETFCILSFSQIIIILLNKYFELNFISKYLMLVIVLTVIVKCKNFIKYKLVKL